MSHQIEAQSGSQTPGCTFSLAGVGSNKALPAEGAQSMFLLCGLVLPGILPPTVTEAMVESEERGSNQLKRLRDRSQITVIGAVTLISF